MKKICFFSCHYFYSILSSEYLIACHEEAAGGEVIPTLRGHSPSSRQSGILVTFEGTSATFLLLQVRCLSHFIEAKL